MRRKLFCGIAVFAMIFSTCMTGYAQTSTMDCDPCAKCTPWHIPAVGCTALAQGQTATVNVFDWDATYGYCEQQGQTSFTYPGTNNVALRNCRLVFDICKCPEACQLEEGWVIGVQMEILTPGVYFAADPDVPQFNGATPTPWDDYNVAGTYCYSPNTYQLRFRRLPETAASTPCTTTDFRMGGRTTYDTMKISYYTNATQANAGNEITWAVGPGAAGQGLAKVVRTPTPYDGWELTEADVDNQLCNFWYDVPAMIASGTVTSGQTVQLKVSLLASEPLEDLLTVGASMIDYLRPANAVATQPTVVDTDTSRWATTGAADWLLGAPPYLNQGLYWENFCATTPVICGTPGFNYDRDAQSNNDGDADDLVLIGNGNCRWQWDQKFCPTCTSPCSCTIDLGILCCEAAGGSYCMTFPYVLQQTDDWMTGIALTRLCAPATGITPAVTLTLTDCEGAKFTHTITPFGQCLEGVSLDALLTEYGWDPEPGQGWLQVESNFPLGGYQFNLFDSGHGMFGAGILPEGCYSCQ